MSTLTIARPFRAVTLVVFVLAGCVPAANSLRDTVDVGAGRLGPVPAGEAFQVRTTGADARSVVLESERETGWPDPDVAWQDGGCVLVAWYAPRSMSFMPDPGPPYPVYLVRLIDPAAAGSSTWVMVDARTGELGAAVGRILPGCPGTGAPAA